jgi:receptor protein-tyrosine kinase
MSSSLKQRAERSERKTNDLSGRLTTVVYPNGAASEAYRALGTKLLYARVDMPPKVIVVTSPGPREGKSTVCANLGVVLAQAGKNTLILDCDFRLPVMHKIFKLSNAEGIVDVLMRNRRLQETWHEPLPGLTVMPVGPLPPSPVEFVSSRRFAKFLTQVRQEFEYVLVDAPPVGAVSYALALATEGDAVLLVFDAQNTRKVAVRQAMRSLESIGANVLGTVMNNIEDNKAPN